MYISLFDYHWRYAYAFFNTYFTARWTPEEAYYIIQFLDEPRELLMRTYDRDIGGWLQAQQASPVIEAYDVQPF